MKTLHAIWMVERVIEGEVVPAHMELWAVDGDYPSFICALDWAQSEARSFCPFNRLNPFEFRASC